MAGVVEPALGESRVDYVGGGDVIALGSVVKVHDAEYDEDIDYTIVGVMEADDDHPDPQYGILLDGSIYWGPASGV